jgi:hypothetical protein
MIVQTTLAACSSSNDRYFPQQSYPPSRPLEMGMRGPVSGTGMR